MAMWGKINNPFGANQYTVKGTGKSRLADAVTRLAAIREVRNQQKTLITANKQLRASQKLDTYKGAARNNLIRANQLRDKAIDARLNATFSRANSKNPIISYVAEQGLILGSNAAARAYTGIYGKRKKK